MCTNPFASISVVRPHVRTPSTSGWLQSARWSEVQCAVFTDIWMDPGIVHPLHTLRTVSTSPHNSLHALVIKNLVRGRPLHLSKYADNINNTDTTAPIPLHSTIAVSLHLHELHLHLHRL